MITFFAAIGRYHLEVDRRGVTYPVIVTYGGKESIPDIQEMVIWSSLLWRIQTYDELKETYLREAEKMKICSEASFDHYINRLQQRGLIVEGKDIVGVDAVYNLLSRLYIVPITDSWLAKVAAFIKMTFEGTPLRVTCKIFRRTILSPDESMVIGIARQQLMSTAEIIRCLEKGVSKLHSEEELVDRLYDDEATTSDNIDISSRSLRKKMPVVQAVANLYLKKQIIFEKAL